MLGPEIIASCRSNRLCEKCTRIPEIRVGHFLSLCDGTGLLQHAVHSVPDRSHGYCVDDNARALLVLELACGLWRSAAVPNAHRAVCRIYPACLESRTLVGFEIS